MGVIVRSHTSKARLITCMHEYIVDNMTFVRCITVWYTRQLWDMVRELEHILGQKSSRCRPYCLMAASEICEPQQPCITIAKLSDMLRWAWSVMNSKRTLDTEVTRPLPLPFSFSRLHLALWQSWPSPRPWNKDLPTHAQRIIATTCSSRVMA